MFGGHTSEKWTLEIIRLIVGYFIVNRLSIEGFDVQKHALKLLQVELDPHHKFFQVIKKFRNGGLGIISPIIDGFDQAASENFFPHSVGNDFGETGIFR